MIALSVALLALVPIARADTVVTTAGKTHTGRAEWVANSIEVTPEKGGAKSTVPLAELAAATFDPPATTVAKKPSASTRPMDWTPADVGEKVAPGRVEFGRDRDAGVVTLFDTPYSPRSYKYKKNTSFDHFVLLGQTVAGDVTLVARLRTLDDGKGARAGLIVRAVGADGACAMVGRGPDGTTVLHRRAVGAKEGEDIAKSTTPVFGATWLKLARQGNTFTASESTDGKAWTAVGTCEIPLEAEVVVGLAAHSGWGTVDGRTVFDNVTLTADASAASAGRAARGVVTAGGSFVAGEVGDVVDGQIEILKADGPGRRIPLDRVARVVLGSLLPAQAEKLAALADGVMLANGDVIEGEFKGIEGGKLKVVSVLFGAKSIDARHEAAGVVLRAVATTPAAFEVRLADRSVLRATAVEAVAGKVKLTEADLGVVDIAGVDVVEVRRAGAR
ncbi:MAG: hypothetical protein ACAI43_14700 [Phycisphaerae bacterium]